MVKIVSFKELLNNTYEFFSFKNLFDKSKQLSEEIKNKLLSTKISMINIYKMLWDWEYEESS